MGPSSEVDGAHRDAMAAVPGEGAGGGCDVGAPVGGRRGLLRAEALREHLETEIDPRGDMARDDDGLCRLRLGGTPVPVLSTLVAAKP